MHKADLQFLHSNLIMERFLSEDPFCKVAQENDGGFFSKVQSDVTKLLANSKEHPIESILSFIGPGFAWMFGFKKIALAMTLAEALGFDVDHFYASIREKLKPLLEGMEAGTPADSSAVDSIVQASGEEAMSGQPNIDKLQDVVMKADASLNNMLFLYKMAKRTDDPRFMKWIKKDASILDKYRKGILGFIVSIFGWLITAVVFAAGFKLLGKGVAHLLGTDKSKQENGNTETTSSLQDDNSQVKLYLNPSASPELSTTTPNNDEHVWLLNANINHLHDQLIQWAQELYPQLTDKNAFDASSDFHKTLQLFKDRNKGSADIDIIAVPTAFHSIREIVLSFVPDVAKHITDNSNVSPIQRKS